MLFDGKGESRPPALAKADRAHDYNHLQLKRESGRAAVVALSNPTDGLRRGSIPRTQLFSSAAAVLRYNCFSCAIAFLACRILEIPIRGILWRFSQTSPEQ